MVHSLNHFHHEEGVFAHQVIVLEIHDNILAARVADHVSKAFCCALDIRRRIIGAADVHANARATDLHSDVYEFFRMGNRLFAGGGVLILRLLYPGRDGLALVGGDAVDRAFQQAAKAFTSISHMLFSKAS